MPYRITAMFVGIATLGVRVSAADGGWADGPSYWSTYDGSALINPDAEKVLPGRMADTFAEGCELHNIDIAGAGGSCGRDGSIDIFDIFAVLDAFVGIDDCCP